MFLKRIEIDNYKSLKGVVVEPTPLTALVGPNSAGKTNFCEALDFLAHAYHWSLEEAVVYKGGYENICFRGNRGSSKKPIRFRVALPDIWTPRSIYEVDHTFEFGISQTSSTLVVSSEALTATPISESRPVLDFSREHDRFRVKTHTDPAVFITKETLPELLDKGVGVGDLSFSMLRHLAAWGGSLAERMEAIRIFHLNSRDCRVAGIPTPKPNLERFGANLPAVILHLKKEHPKQYTQILAGLGHVLPDVEELEVDFTHTRTLSLFVRQRGQLWPAEDLSDGTIQAIATLTAIYDPRSPLLVLEEPENNVHPWVLRAFAEAFREASKTKQIILTTHSPIMIDQLKPEEIWVVQKPGAVTKIDPLLKLDPSLQESWEHGHFTLSEYLDSGARPEAVPAAAS